MTIRDAKGAAVADAVVTVETPEHKPPPARFAQPLEVKQHNLQFEPFVLVVPVGAEVRFPNEDSVHHQVYSFSPAKTFELKLYGKDQTRAVRFDKPGVVSLGCNIHDQMVAFIVVTDAAFAGKSDASGHLVLHGLPPGAATIHVWHPYLRGAGAGETLGAVLPPTGTLTRAVSVNLRTPAMRSSSY